MAESESNNLEAENWEEDEQIDQNNGKKEDYNINNNNINNNEIENDNENEEEEQENESENNNNMLSNENENNNSKMNKSSKRSKVRNTKSQYTENTLSQNNNENNINNTITKKTEENNEEGDENPEILYEEFFNYFLPNKRNSLSIKECKNAMRCLGLVVTEREIQNFLDIKIKTGKEKINLEEFKYICNKKLTENGNNIAELEEAFEIMDPEKTGIVDSRILRHQMKVFKPKITDEEISQILSEFGEDENGNINYKEYLKNLKN